MPLVICDGDLITLSPGTCTPATVINKVKGTGTKTTAGNKVAISGDDKSWTMRGIAYTTAAASIPGTGNIEFTWPSESSTMTSNDKAVMINSGTGTWKLTPTAPAKIPGSPPVPDASPSHTGTFTITTSQSVLTAT